MDDELRSRSFLSNAAEERAELLRDRDIPIPLPGPFHCQPGAISFKERVLISDVLPFGRLSVSAAAERGDFLTAP